MLTVVELDAKLQELREQIAATHAERAVLESQLADALIEGADDGLTEAKISALPSRIAALETAIARVTDQRRVAEANDLVTSYEAVVYEVILTEHARREEMKALEAARAALDVATKSAADARRAAETASQKRTLHRQQALGMGGSEGLLTAADNAAVARARDEFGIDLSKE